MTAPGPRPGSGTIAAALVAALAGAGGFIVAYLVDAPNGWLGGTLAVAFGGLAVALAWWSRRLMPHDDEVEERPVFEAGAASAEAAHDVEEGTLPFRRRRLLLGLLGSAGGALVAALALPLGSLGPLGQTGRILRQTGWRSGLRLVDAEGRPVPADALQRGEVVTVFPEGGGDRADDQALLLALDPARLSLPPERAGWTPGGLTCYSKVCTHAGCPVGLFQQEQGILVCPCHQASFDVHQGAEPVFGPAARALPQLPLMVDDEGFLVAAADFSGPIGPSWWYLGGDEA